jgi:hypothetical protein
MTAVLSVALVGCNDKPEDHSTTTTPSTTTGDRTTTTPSTTTGDRTITTPSTTTTDRAVTAPADNTAKNARDDGSAVTPVDQGNSEGDIAITQAIRKAVVADKSLSVNAQNAKIITKNGVVTLRGPVANAAERTAIGDIAQKVSGVQRVDNQLEVANP